MAEYQLNVIPIKNELCELENEQQEFHFFHQDFFSNSFVKLSNNKTNIKNIMKHRKDKLNNHQKKQEIVKIN
jgi:hypothetical protein